MADSLIYQTSDPKFADRAIEALLKAGIPCYRTGRGTARLNATIGRWTDDQVCIFVRHQSDCRRANEQLIKLGAYVDRPKKLPSRWIVAIVILTLLVLATVVANM
jgi:hypothetical protein